VLGGPYRAPDEDAALSERDPYKVDPAVVERGLRGHRRTQNLLAAIAERNGAVPRSPCPGEPNFDLAWSIDRRIWVAEVKSSTDRNEEKQLRLGLGQVLRYRQLLSDVHEGSVVIGVLAVERKPADATWQELCDTVGVALVWPQSMESLFT
jgi:hypothetical protein